MGEIRLSHCCRLCLKEGFSLTNIFSQRSASGDPLYQILNFIYEMKVFENDGLPSQICSPCMWRMIEFDACKKNVRSAESEIMRLLSQTRPDEPSENEVAMEERPVNSEVSIKEEFDIVEWEMPANTVIKDPEAAQQFQEADKDDSNDIESDEMVHTNEIEEGEWQMPKVLKREAMDFEPTLSSDSKNHLSLEASEETVGNLFEGESICTTQDHTVEMRDAKKLIHENYWRDDVAPGMDSTYAELSGGIVNDTELCHLKSPLSKRKSRFICDICGTKFISKWNLGNHIRIHYDERPFSCNVCEKNFKQDTARYLHEIKHGKDKIGKRSKKYQYSCVVCSKNFSSRGGLIGHSNLHSDKFKCEFCGKAFAGNANLTIHLRIHTKERPFKCEVCSKCFCKKSDLKRHLLIHSSEKSFSCDTCDKRFKTKRGKTVHVLTHLRKE